MFVTSIDFGWPSAENNTLCPKWTQVEQELRDLDGEKKDGVILASSGQSYMGISGGKDDQYVVAGYVDGIGSFICANGKENELDKQVVVNGDFNVYASANVVGFETVIASAREFYDRGALTRAFKWESKPRPVSSNES